MKTFARGLSYTAALALCAAWILVVAIDFMDVGGIGSALALQESVAYHLFREGSVIEMFQWLCLVTAIIICSFLAARHEEIADRSSFTFYLLLAVAFAVMVLEDAGNIRHEFDRWLSFVSPYSYEIATVTLYALLGGVITWATLKHGRDLLLADKRAATIYVVAFLAYGLAAVSSATQFLWYGDVGAAISALAAHDPGGFVLMDLMYEESLELIGALLFVLFLSHQFAPSTLAKAPAPTNRP